MSFLISYKINANTRKTYIIDFSNINKKKKQNLCKVNTKLNVNAKLQIKIEVINVMLSLNQKI